MRNGVPRTQTGKIDGVNIEVIAIDDTVTMQPTSTGREFTLLDEFVTLLNIDGRGEVIKVPAGFHTDLASVPRLIWGWIPPLGRYLRAAIVHDYLYRTARLPRPVADKAFHALMRRAGVGPIRARLMYWAVRLAGRFAYADD